MCSHCRIACIIIPILLLFAACSGHNTNGTISSISTNTNGEKRPSDHSEHGEIEYVSPSSDISSFESPQYSSNNQLEETENAVPLPTLSSFEYSGFRDFYEQNKNIEIKELIHNALIQLDLSESAPYFKFAADDYYERFYSFVYSYKLEMPDIVSAEVVPVPEDLDCEIPIEDYAICLIDHDGNRYTVVLSTPGLNSGFVALYYNGILLDSYYIIE